MEIIETYHHGELVEVRQIPSVSIPNIANFNNQMMLADSYARLVSNTSSQSAKNRLEIAAVRLELKVNITDEDLAIFKFIWDAVVDGVAEGILTAADCDEWNQIAKSNNMPFAFAANFKMSLTNLNA